MHNLLSLLAWQGVAITFAAVWTAPMWRNPRVTALMLEEAVRPRREART